MKTFIFLISFLFINSKTSIQDDWVYLGKNYNQGFISFVKKDYESYDNGIIKVWRKDNYEILTLKINNENKKFYSAYILSLVENDLINKKYRIISQIAYSADGNVLYSNDNDDNKWKHVPPDSVGEKLQKYFKEKL